MKRLVFVLLAVSLGLCLAGCGKKEAPVEESLEPMTMESLGALNATTPDIKPQVPEQALPGQTAALEPLPPAGPYKPSVNDMQTALKNAGYYTGAVDGKKGPLTKKAIEDFQRANGLEVDGKVGPKTWAVLSPYLNPAPAPEQTQQKKR
jgi:peptidoglycan hydrolase-like protein with peptidoglycan-binding domain